MKGTCINGNYNRSDNFQSKYQEQNKKVQNIIEHLDKMPQKLKVNDQKKKKVEFQDYKTQNSFESRRSDSSSSSEEGHIRVIAQQSIKKYNQQLFAQKLSYGYIPRYPMSQEPFSEVPSQIVEAQPIIQQQQLRQKQMKNTQKIQDPLEYPYSAIGHLSFRFRDDGPSYYCTAFLISQNLIITAAQNIYNQRGQFKIPKKVFFCPGLDGQSGRMFRAKIIYCPQPYMNNQFQQSNYIVLKLQYNIGSSYGYLGIDFRDCRKQNKFCMSGYPSMIPSLSRQEIAGYNFCKTGKIQTNQQSKLINFQVISTSGQSGSPIFFKEGKHYFVVGINIGKSTFGINFHEKIRENLNTIPNQVMDLDLSSKQLNNQTYRKFLLLKSVSINQITLLDLSNNNITDQGVKYLSQCTFPNIKSLNLSNNNITDKGAQFLSRGYWVKLKKLLLDNTQIMENGVNKLLNVMWTSLKHLSLKDSLSNVIIKNQYMNEKGEKIEIINS